MSVGTLLARLQLVFYDAVDGPQKERGLARDFRVDRVSHYRGFCREMGCQVRLCCSRVVTLRALLIRLAERRYERRRGRPRRDA